MKAASGVFNAILEAVLEQFFSWTLRDGSMDYLRGKFSVCISGHKPYRWSQM